MLFIVYRLFVMDNQDEIKNMINLVKKLYEELKDVPAEDLQKEFVSKLAEIIHNEQSVDNKQQLIHTLPLLPYFL